MKTTNMTLEENRVKGSDFASIKTLPACLKYKINYGLHQMFPAHQKYLLTIQMICPVENKSKTRCLVPESNVAFTHINTLQILQRVQILTWKYSFLLGNKSVIKPLRRVKWGLRGLLTVIDIFSPRVPKWRRRWSCRKQRGHLILLKMCSRTRWPNMVKHSEGKQADFFFF